MAVRRRIKISYRVSLLVAIPGLVVVLTGLIIWQSYSAASRETEELAHALFRDLSRQAFHRTREHLASAPQTVGLLQELSEQGRLEGSRQELARECGRIREQGYSTDFAEADEGIHCVAAPVRGPGGEVLAALWISAPSRRLPRSAFAESAVGVRAAADQISERLIAP